MASAVAWGVTAFSVYALYKLVRLALADADLHLLGKGRHHPKAFQGKVVWITGASQGLGEILAKYFAGHGAKLILSSRKADRLERVKASLGVPASDVLVLPFDLCGDFGALEAAAAAADAAFGGAGVDYLVHNAGASQNALAEEVTAEVTDAMFAVNTLGPIKLTRAVLPLMLARGKGRFVVVCSMAGKVPSPGQAVYSACKMALYGYFASLATEIADRGVGVTICCPGPAATGSTDTPRAVYGPTGLITQAQPHGGSARMPAERTAQLIATAAAHGLDEAWISRHPVLAVGHIFQFLPRLGWLLLKRVGPKRARAMKEGKSGYDIRSIAKAPAK